MSRRNSRRRFLKQTAWTGITVWAGSSMAENKSPNERLNVAAIGVGGKGSSDCDQAANLGNLVAICDVDDNPLNGKANQFPMAKKFHDFRAMFDQMANQIDAVTVSTPDHTHAPASILAMKLGKHVYCQKPLTHSVAEARQMREVANQYKVATQMGNQGTAEDGLRAAVEVVQSGAIGPVREVHVWTNRPIWPQAPEITARPKEMMEVPKNVHWDLFLGPAQDRPYHGAYHPFKWRGWWDFGTGALGDMGCHTANMAFMALKLGYPTAISADADGVNPETCPSFATVTYDFPARGEMPPVKLIWHEGKRDGKNNLPPAEFTMEEHVPASGLLLVGDKGILFSPNDYGASYVLLPKKNFMGYKPPEPTLPRVGGGDQKMKEEWIRAAKGGPPAMSNFNYAGMLTEAILLGNVAIRAKKRIEWDGPNLRVTNCPEAAQYVSREYRKGWTF